MDEDRIKEIKSRKIVSLINESEEIVISGIGGRFPSSESLDEFADNLYNNIDMITEDVNGERWPKGKQFLSYNLLIVIELKISCFKQICME